jgi:putative restriction endonuclease
VDGATVVDAAHIHRFAESGNNDPRNGLALSKNAHWMFDLGLWTPADDLTVEVAAGAFDEAGPEGLRLAPYRGRRVAYLPRDPTDWPDPAHLAWHRRNVFAAG